MAGARSQGDAAAGSFPHANGGAAMRGGAAIDSLGIVGVGLIGGSLALAARRAWPGLRVAGVDRGAALESARFLTAFDALGDSLDVLHGVRVIVLAAPVRQNIAVLERLAALLDGPVLITDTGSTKRAMMDAAAGLPAHLSFVGGHPLAGAARGGLGLARADLFAGRAWLVTAGASTRSEADVARVEDMARALGADPQRIGAADHDALFAFLSHLPQLAASALMHTVGARAGDRIGLAGPGLADTTRLASSPADIWQDICATNADDIRPALDALIDALQRVRAQLDDPEAIARLFDSARAWRDRIS